MSLLQDRDAGKKDHACTLMGGAGTEQGGVGQDIKLLLGPESSTGPLSIFLYPIAFVVVRVYCNYGYLHQTRRRHR
jgi:hypothetical protein